MAVDTLQHMRFCCMLHCTRAAQEGITSCRDLLEVGRGHCPRSAVHLGGTYEC